MNAQDKIIAEKLAGKHKENMRKNRFIFFIIVILLVFLIKFTIFDSYLQMARQSFNPFKAFLLIAISIAGIIVAYLKLFRDNSAIIKAKAQAAQQKLHQIKIESTNSVRQAVLLFRGAKTKEEILTSMQSIFDIGLTYDFHRQGCVDLLYQKVSWMETYKTNLFSENLNNWRIRKACFPTTDQFPVEAEQQEFAMIALSYLEQLIKKHCEDHLNEVSKITLDLASKFLPALNFSSVNFPNGSINFEYAVLWQNNFWQSSLDNINFRNADLTNSHFFKTILKNPNFSAAKLQNCTFRTDFSSTPTLTNIQFFQTHNWQLNLLTPEQVDTFFPDKSDKSEHWDKWLIGGIERKNFFRTLSKK